MISNTDCLKVLDKIAPIFICFRMRFLPAFFSSSTKKTNFHVMIANEIYHIVLIRSVHDQKASKYHTEIECLAVLAIAKHFI